GAGQARVEGGAGGRFGEIGLRIPALLVEDAKQRGARAAGTIVERADRRWRNHRSGMDYGGPGAVEPRRNDYAGMKMNPEFENHRLREITRRHFFSKCGIGLGSVALASLMGGQKSSNAEGFKMVNPLAPKQGHFPGRAKNVIFLFMAGGPSQLELFD